MLDNLSMRSRQIVFAARFKAGERGASTIDADDFLVGLVLEDQGTLEKDIFGTIFEGQGTSVNRAQFHIPFFSQKVAEDLLTDLKKYLQPSPPVALTQEIPLSPSLERVFNSAKAVQTQFQHSHVEPLHLLAGILSEGASQGVKMLQDSGITLEKVMLTLSRGAAET
jgi:ATP-dependent Clp protease ATP-binding subunit ClpA